MLPTPDRAVFRVDDLAQRLEAALLQHARRGVELRERMRGWLEGAYRAVIFAVGSAPVAYALYRESEDEIYLRQFFVDRGYRRHGLGREAIRLLQTELWPRDKRWTVEVLTGNAPAVAFWRAVGYVDYCLTLETLPVREG